MACNLLTDGYMANHEECEIAEWIDVWEHHNARLPKEVREAIITSTVLHAKGGPYRSMEGKEEMRNPMSAWRLSGVVTDVLSALVDGGLLPGRPSKVDEIDGDR